MKMEYRSNWLNRQTEFSIILGKGMRPEMFQSITNDIQHQSVPFSCKISLLKGYFTIILLLLSNYGHATQ